MGDVVGAEAGDRPAAMRDDGHPARSSGGTCPLDRRDAGLLLLAYVALTAVWVGLGELLTGPLRDSAIVRADLHVARHFAERRTETWNTVAEIGTFPAETLVKVLATTAICVVMLIVWRRWLEPLLVALALILEASAFITVTWIVGRPRPDVPRLEDSPVDSSFPSGHTAAAAAYAAIAIVIFWHVRATWIRALTVAVAIALPLGVGLARAYAGMHYISDVVAGVLLGMASVYVTWLILREAPRGDRRPRRMSERSKRIIDTVLFAAQRRTAHWCPVETDAVSPLHESMVHQ